MMRSYAIFVTQTVSLRRLERKRPRLLPAATANHASGDACAPVSACAMSKTDVLRYEIRRSTFFQEGFFFRPGFRFVFGAVVAGAVGCESGVTAGVARGSFGEVVGGEVGCGGVVVCGVAVPETEPARRG